MSETVEPPAGRVSGVLALGRRLAEQYQRDGGASYQLAALAHPSICKQAMQAAAAEEQYYAKCQALGGISVDVARQVLADAFTVADKNGLAMNEAVRGGSAFAVGACAGLDLRFSPGELIF